MLYSIVVNFRAENHAIIPATRGYHAYALFLNMLSRANARVAQELHDLEGTKPFTISPLQGKFHRQKDGLGIEAGGIYWVRLTFLRAETFACFMDAALKAGDSVVRLDNAALRIYEILSVPGSSPLCRCQTAESILSGAPVEREIILHFLSPTVFRSGGKRNVLFPEPRLLFNSYFSRWQAFSSLPLHNGIPELVDKGVRIAQYQLQTRILHFGSYQEIGFEGRCVLELADELPDEAVQSISALADFAFYCGTGAKTTMGMGQTRRPGYGRSLSRRAGSHAS